MKTLQLIETLDRCLSLDDVRELDHRQLIHLRELLHHWHEIADHECQKRQIGGVQTLSSRPRRRR